MPPSPPAPALVLLVEDDADVGGLVVGAFGALGHAVTWVRDGPSALAQVAGARGGGVPFALVVLDLSLPTLDGLDVLARLRADDRATPVLVLSARAATRDVVRGFELGADDYVTKPFDADVLAARVGRLLRRAAEAPGDGDGVIHRGTLTVDPVRWRVRRRGADVALTPREFELLLLLAGHPGRTFSRDELLETLWGPGFDGYGHTVNTHINRLRRKVEADPAHPTCIETVWGVGYRFSESDTACP